MIPEQVNWVKSKCANYERDNVDLIVETVKQKLTDRSQVGISKYGTTIWDNTDENYIKHLQDELLDGANYCEQIMRLGKFTETICKIVEENEDYPTIGEKVIQEYKKLKHGN